MPIRVRNEGEINTISSNSSLRKNMTIENVGAGVVNELFLDQSPDAVQVDSYVVSEVATNHQQTSSNSANAYRTTETIDKLKRLFAEHKHSILQNTVDFPRLLTDYLPVTQYRKEFNILHSVFSKSNIGSKLYDKHSATTAEQAMIGNQIISTLVDEHGLGRDAAEFAIGVVVVAMGWQPLSN